MLPAVLLALIGLASPGSAADAQIEVLEGRVSLAAADGVFEVRAGQAPRVVQGAGYVEVPPLSRVSLRWRQTGSLLIEGPAAFEWSPERERLIWNFRQVGRTHLEIRSPHVRVYLPGGWIAAFENGASFLTERSGGAVEFHHDAGLPVLLSGPTKAGSARPPWTILAGARLLLRPVGGRPAALRGTHGRLLEPYGRPEAFARERHSAGARWSGFSWPWRARMDQTVAAFAPAQEPGLAADPMLQLGSSPAPPPAHAQPNPSATGAAPGDTEPDEPDGPDEPDAAAPSAAGTGASMVPLSRGPEGPPGLPELSGAAAAEFDLGAYVPQQGADSWQEFKTHIRREGQLMLTPYGVRWRDYASGSDVTPQQP